MRGKNCFLIWASTVILGLVFAEGVFSERDSDLDSDNGQPLPRLDNRNSSPRRSPRINTAARGRNGNGNGNGNANRRQKGTCPKMNIENGVTTLKQRGLVARYFCSHDYELFGSEFSFCTRGQWSESPPICTRPGCRPLFFPVEGQATSLLSNSVMEFSCNPGYNLKGSSILFCNGIRWNGTEPECEAIPNLTVMTPQPQTTTPVFTTTTNSPPILQSRFPLPPPPTTTMLPKPTPNPNPNPNLFDTSSHEIEPTTIKPNNTKEEYDDDNDDDNDIDVSWKIFRQDNNKTSSGENSGNTTTTTFGFLPILPISSTTEAVTNAPTTTRGRESEEAVKQSIVNTTTTISIKVMTNTESPSNSIDVFPANSQGDRGEVNSEKTSPINTTSFSYTNATVDLITNNIENKSTTSFPPGVATTSVKYNNSNTTITSATTTTTEHAVVTHLRNLTWNIKILPTNSRARQIQPLNSSLSSGRRPVVVPEIISMNRTRPSSISVTSCMAKNFQSQQCRQYLDSLRSRNRFLPTSNSSRLLFTPTTTTPSTTGTPRYNMSNNNSTFASLRPNVFNITAHNFPFMNATAARIFPNVRIRQNYSTVVRTGNSRVNNRNQIRISIQPTTKNFPRAKTRTTTKTTTPLTTTTTRLTTVTATATTSKTPTLQMTNTSINNSNNNNTHSNFDNTIDQYIKVTSNQSTDNVESEREEIEQITEEKVKHEFITPFTLHGLTNKKFIEGDRFSQSENEHGSRSSILITSISILFGVALIGSFSFLILRLYRKFKGISRAGSEDSDGKNLSVHHDAEEDFVYFGNSQL